ETFSSWLQQLIEEGSDYQSPVSEKDSFFISRGFVDKLDLEDVDVLHVDVSLVDGVELDLVRFRGWRAEYRDAEFILEDGKYICGVEVEKMSKSKYNTVNPDELCERYGADTFRMYEMFLGPVEASKPWDTKGIEGVHRFLKKLWRLFYNESGLQVSNEKASPEELKVLHKAIKKIEHDTSNFSFNTAVSAFMVCVNELTELKCNKKEILEPLLILLAPYAPHITEELWHSCGNNSSILLSNYPELNESLLVESVKDYPVSVNGKLRTNISISLQAEAKEVEEIVLKNDVVQKWLEGKAPKKIIYIAGKMINVVV
ncbi:MAG: leucine--tRNA ligase, partial [Chitinophagaceae bacterium]